MLYKVFIPAISEDGFNINLKLEAENWISALRSGLSKIGEQGDVIKNVMVEIQSDGTIEVADPRSGRVFEIKELPPGTPVETPPPTSSRRAEAAPVQPSAAAAASLPPMMEPGDELPTLPDLGTAGAVEQARGDDEAVPTTVLPSWVSEPKVEAPAKAVIERPRAIDMPPAHLVETVMEQPRLPKAEPAETISVRARKDTYEAPAEPAEPEPPEPFEEDLPIDLPAEPRRARPGKRVRRPTALVSDDAKAVTQDPDSQILKETRTVAAPQDVARAKRQAVFQTEEVLADVFMDAQRLYEFDTDVQSSVEFALDMLMDKIPSEAGSVLFADINQNDLYFASARGPKAEEVMDFRVPMGTGLVGFCAKEGVALAIGDVARDPRFYKRIGESIGFETRSVVCAPVESDGRCYGAVELINRHGSEFFSVGEMSVVSYVANRLADFINQVVMREA